MEHKYTYYEPEPLLPIWLELLFYFIAFFFVTIPIGGVFVLPFHFIAKSESIYYVIAEQLANSIPTLLSATMCAVLFTKKMARRPLSDLGFSIKGRGKDCLAGILFAMVFYGLGFGISLLLGAFEIVAVQVNVVSLLGSLLVFFIAASFEEVMIRAYLQGRLMTKMNKFAALAIASLVFSLLHAWNDHISVTSLFNLFLAGTLLGASYMYTRNIWFPISLHTMWNWIQGPVLGYEVSGMDVFPTLLKLHLPEENIINGGSFGFEGSIICTMLMILGTALIISYYEGKKSV